MRRPSRIAGVVCGVLLGASAAAVGDGGPAPNRVEEDWRVVIAEPDPDAEGPQMTTCMTPNRDQPTRFVAFGLNYRLRPSPQAGGLQVLAWSGDELLSRAAQGDAPLETTDETITWTQELSLSGGQATYRVKSGQSTTWGGFGGGDSLSVAFSTDEADLSLYDPEQTATRSAATWQSDHVAGMVLLRVRYYHDAELLETRELNRDVLQAP